MMMIQQVYPPSHFIGNGDDLRTYKEQLSPPPPPPAAPPASHQLSSENIDNRRIHVVDHRRSVSPINYTHKIGSRRSPSPTPRSPPLHHQQVILLHRPQLSPSPPPPPRSHSPAVVQELAPLIRSIKRYNSVEEREYYDDEEPPSHVARTNSQEHLYDSEPEANRRYEHRIHELQHHSVEQQQHHHHHHQQQQQHHHNNEEEYHSHGATNVDTDDNNSPLDLSLPAVGRRRDRTFSGTESDDSGGPCEGGKTGGKAAYKKSLMKRYCK